MPMNESDPADVAEGVAVVLLAHLEFEEEAVGPTMLGWSRWPF